jgi:hypothetical protein
MDQQTDFAIEVFQRHVLPTEVLMKTFLVHPIKAYFASCIALILSLKNSISLKP